MRKQATILAVLLILATTSNAQNSVTEQEAMNTHALTHSGSDRERGLNRRAEPSPGVYIALLRTSSGTTAAKLARR